MPKIVLIFQFSDTFCFHRPQGKRVAECRLFSFKILLLYILLRRFPFSLFEISNFPSFYHLTVNYLFVSVIFIKWCMNHSTVVPTRTFIGYFMRVCRKIVECVCNLKQHAVVEKLVELLMKILFSFPSENNVKLRNKIHLKKLRRACFGLARI